MRGKGHRNKDTPYRMEISVFTGIKKNDLVNCNVFFFNDIETQGIPYVKAKRVCFKLTAAQ